MPYRWDLCSKDAAELQRRLILKVGSLLKKIGQRMYIYVSKAIMFKVYMFQF